ncbi:MAG: nucleotidyltransferase domain-containing protein [Candidatus Heimdallarchaeota archaeon]|nr:nucleotidyltransferase domain-containing protein [Candidatus Heimdallarchaeota archaeon]MCK5047799.1 nucleotidyltransferase domain-containing protein [Candidatus Heimdallarchaeota archaeon]
MVNAELINQLEKDLKMLMEESEVIGIVLFGSIVTNQDHHQSDIDICVVVSEPESSETFHKVLRFNQPPYDIKLFHNLPVHVGIEVINNHFIIYERKEFEISEFFYFKRRMYEDEMRRQELSSEELNELINSF